MVTPPTATEEQRSITATTKQQMLRDKAITALAKHITEILLDAKCFRSCLTCYNWNHEGELCKKYGERPPAKVIVMGCESHSDEIPF